MRLRLAPRALPKGRGALCRHRRVGTKSGGDDEIRTHDLCSAIAALSQLSYIPKTELRIPNGGAPSEDANGFAFGDAQNGRLFELSQFAGDVAADGRERQLEFPADG